MNKLLLVSPLILALEININLLKPNLASWLPGTISD